VVTSDTWRFIESVAKALSKNEAFLRLLNRTHSHSHGENSSDPIEDAMYDSIFDAHTILKADTDDTPVALTVNEQEVVGRLTGGNIDGIAIGISDDNMVQVDGSPNSGEVALWTANGLEGRAIGVNDDNILEVDDATVITGDYAKFTANGLEGQQASQVMADLSGEAGFTFDWVGCILENVEAIKGLTDDTLDIVGKRTDSDDSVKISTPGEAINYADTVRVTFQGRAAEADVVWTDCEHTGLKLGGDLNADSHNITSLEQAITDNHIVTVDGSPNDDEYARWTASGLEGRTAAEAKTDLGFMTDLVDDATPQLGGDLDLNGNNIDFPTTADISDCLDEDDLVSDSATALATQQSIKAYADGKITTHEAAADPHTGYVKESEFTAKGDVLGGTGAGTLAALGVGTDEYCLIADSGETTGLNWGKRATITTASATYYVDGTNGNDSNPGTQADPFATIQGAWDSLPDIIAHDITIIVEDNGRKTGTADGRVANHLQDDTNAQFAAGDVGKTVFNVTDGNFATITAYNDTGDVTLDTDIFDNGNEDYVIYATPYREDVDISERYVMASVTIRGEYYWQGDCEANVGGAGEIKDTGAFGDVAVGDKVVVLDLSGADGRAVQGELCTVDDISNAPDRIGTTGSLTPTTSWIYWIVRTEISGSDDGTDGGTARDNCFLLTSIDNITVQGFYLTYSDMYAFDTFNCRKLISYYMVFENCDYDLRVKGHSCFDESDFIYFSGSYGCVVEQSSYMTPWYCMYEGCTYGIDVYRNSGAIPRYSFIKGCSYGVIVQLSGAVDFTRCTIDAGTTNGIYAFRAGFVFTSKITNNATTPKTPAAASDPAWVT